MCIAMNLPSSVNLREKYKIQVYDQGGFGADVACSIATAINITGMQEYSEEDALGTSRLFLYYEENETTS